MATTTSTRLLTTSQAAHRLGIPPAQLAALRQRGQGPEWGRFATTIRYSTDELDKWQQATRQHTTGRRGSGAIPGD
ncbi:helix-turn-helix domain-containing protein [Aeromicrobium yanjiei]|uniref:Helix-turn-helix domain-containing protein n=1 Tax=Aeromicrobium yanjiei TaxID=2662028 RepID=A0A5Q2MIX2_9ACTN|nr:helix-turn-helix domain-containing protein [Aeromicrobium yanjiei]QGG39900.1 helix-turn-helix domain-containing protein [Aeromicrobium yanjiei]